MKQQTQIILYHLLPAVFWVLAISGSMVPLLPVFHSPFPVTNYIPALLALLSVYVISCIRRHAPSEEACFQVALLLGIASYWLPSVLFLILPIWGYLIYRNLFSGRSFAATLIGWAVASIWAALFIYWGWIANPWAEFFALKNLQAWIPTGLFLSAWLASSIAREHLRIR